MTYNKQLKQSVSALDVISARAALIAYIDNDATTHPMVALRTADMVNTDFERNGLQLYEQDDGQTLLAMDMNVDASTWNRVKASMRLNFSRDKVEFATKLAERLREKNVFGFQPSNTNKTNCVSTDSSTSRQAAPSTSNIGPNSNVPTSVNKPLENALAQKDVIKARAAIISSIDTDMASGGFTAMPLADQAHFEFYKVGMNLFEKDDGHFDFEPESLWNLGLWNKTKAALRLNFSREKIEFASKMTRALQKPVLAQKAANQYYTNDADREFQDGAIPSRNYSGDQRNKVNHSRVIVAKRQSPAKQSVVVGAVVFGAVVGGVVGAVVGAPMAGVVIGGAVAGGVTYCKNK